MGFYFRKSFNAGPVRLNLSKSGIGVSAGVKGLRVGTGPHGTYIAGGREGFYFREHLSSTSTDDESSLTIKSVFGSSPGVVKEYFIDTGVTYPSNIQKSDIDILAIPQFPRPIKVPIYLYIFGIIILFLALNTSLVFTVLSIIILVIALTVTIQSVYIKKDKKKTIGLIDEFKKVLDDDNEFSFFLTSKKFKKLNKKFIEIFAYQSMFEFIKKNIDNMDQKFKDRVTSFKTICNMSDHMLRSIKVRIFREIFDRFMEDHLLDDNEERALHGLTNNLGIPEKDISNEIRSIEIMSQIRKAIEAELKPIDIDIKIQKSEMCYFISQAKILKKKILKTRTLQGTKIKDIGYVIEKEGKVYLTNKRILMVYEGTTTIKLVKILDITTTPEANLLELIIDGRKTPILITLPTAAVFAAKIQQAIDNLK